MVATAPRAPPWWGAGALLRYIDASPVLGLLLFTFDKGVTYKPGTLLTATLHPSRGNSFIQ